MKANRDQAHTYAVVNIGIRKLLIEMRFSVEEESIKSLLVTLPKTSKEEGMRFKTSFTSQIKFNPCLRKEKTFDGSMNHV